MTNKEISEWVEKDADAWSIDASALDAILIDFVQDNNLSKAKAKNLPIHDVMNTLSIGDTAKHEKHYNEGYRESMLTLLHGENKVWDAFNIDVDRYTPDSARRISYDLGWLKAIEDYNS